MVNMDAGDASQQQQQLRWGEAARVTHAGGLQQAGEERRAMAKGPRLPAGQPGRPILEAVTGAHRQLPDP